MLVLYIFEQKKNGKKAHFLYLHITYILQIYTVLLCIYKKHISIESVGKRLSYIKSYMHANILYAKPAESNWHNPIQLHENG